MNIKLGNGERKILIAIIDSGIDTSVSDLSNYMVKSTRFGINPEGFISELPDIKPSSIHGTAVALTIRDICRNVRFNSINILNERMATDSRIMIYAMNEALKLEPDIIHMSIGTTNWRYRAYMKKIVKKANEQNITIVASFNNNGFWPTYPACFKNVVGVKSMSVGLNEKNAFYKKRGRYYAPFSMIDIYGGDQSIVDKMKGTSISAAYITGRIANMKISEGLNSVEDIFKKLNGKK